MPRRKTVTTATPHKSSSHKRGLSTGDPSVTSVSARRASKRFKESFDNTPIKGKVTPKKSQYFEGSDSEDEIAKSSDDEASESVYEDAPTSVSAVSQESSASEEYNSEEDVKPAKKRGRKPNITKQKSQDVLDTGEDLWREGVKTGLGPGKQVFIAKPKARDDGGIKYAPSKIHPNTMMFLADLRKNNDREWLKRHDPDFRQSWKDWESLVETLTEKIAEVDETIPELPPKDLVFRIYRDVRFSSDPTPYKPHFSAAWSRTGRKGPYAAYYVQIQPGGRSFVGGGLWHPDAQPLALLRRSIDRRPERIRGVLVNDLVRKHFFSNVARDEAKAIKAFCGQNAENALKTKPKGYDADHPNIDLLRLRNFTISSRLKDAEVLDAGVLERIVELISAMHPFVTFLNSVVMPDEDQDDEETDGDSTDE